MVDQPDCEVKVNNFKVYLKKVSQHIAGGVRPENFIQIAPKLSKHCNSTVRSNVLEENIKELLNISIEKTFKEFDISGKIRELEEISRLTTSATILQSQSSDPAIIKKYWLINRREILRRRLQDTLQNTAELRKQIDERRAVMKKQIRAMEKSSAQFKTVLL